jgi:hypothetical protein
MTDIVGYLISLAISVIVMIPGGIYLITAPRVLAPIAEGLITRLDLAYLLFFPILEDDLARNKTLEMVAGAPVAECASTSRFASGCGGFRVRCAPKCCSAVFREASR